MKALRTAILVVCVWVHAASAQVSGLNEWSGLSNAVGRAVAVATRSEVRVTGKLVRADVAGLTVLTHNRGLYIDRSSVCDLATIESPGSRTARWVGALAAVGAGVGVFLWLAKQLADDPVSLPKFLGAGAGTGALLGYAAGAAHHSTGPQLVFQAIDRTGCSLLQIPLTPFPL